MKTLHHIDEERQVDFVLRRLSSSLANGPDTIEPLRRYGPHAKTRRMPYEKNSRDVPARNTCIPRANWFLPITIALFALARVAAESGHD